MKTLKTLGLLLSVMISFSSCDLIPFAAKESPTLIYKLGFCFQDASGNNLAEGIGLEEWIPSSIAMEDASWGPVTPDLYTLGVYVFDPCKTAAYSPRLMRKYYKGNWYLTSDVGIGVGDCPEVKKFTYMLKCPYVFGDEDIHEIVTYWNVPKITKSETLFYAECYRIEFEGKEYEPTYIEGHYTATIVLNDDI